MLQILALLAACATLLWLWSLYRRDVSIVDVFWGPAFAIVAGHALWHSSRPTRIEAVTLLCMTALWALRLGIYLAWRNWNEPEDRRYAAMRRRIGARFRWLSLISVFWLQASLVWLISLPLQYALRGGNEPASLWSALGVLLWAVGLSFEAVGDLQLARFKADPANVGRVMDRGLWRYTRHPNYFGDACLWWGLFTVSWDIGAPWWTVLCPGLMTVLLLRVSGVSLLERDIGERRPAYANYVRCTSAFLPWRRGD